MALLGLKVPSETESMTITRGSRDQELKPVVVAPVVSRRPVLKGIGVAAATALVAGTGLLSYRVVDKAALNPGGGDAYAPWKTWSDDSGPRGAVAAAVLAANPHNTQPWKFAVTDGAIDVDTDLARTIGAVDPVRREQQVGLGCTLENLVLACGIRGLGPTVDLLPGGVSGDRVAHVTLTPGPAAPSPLYEAIGRRHTNRGEYDGRAVSPATLAELVDTRGLDGVTVHWVTGSSDMATMGQLLVDAAYALTQDEQQSRDSFGWYRADNDAVQAHRDGITLDAQGMSPIVLGIAKLLPAQSRSSGDSFWVGQTRTLHTKTAAAYGVITAADAYDRRSQLNAGRLLQRIHLTATTLGVALQPMNQITERIDRERVTGAAATFGPRFGALLPPDAQPLVTFRVGYPVRDARPSPRRTLAAVTR